MKTNPTLKEARPSRRGASKLKKDRAIASALEINVTGRVYLALDVHARHCVLGAMRADGAWLGEQRCATSAEALREALARIQAAERWLTFEEGAMALWLCDVLRPLVERLIVCDPRENALIARNVRKRDEWDVRALCRLMRLGELKEVWHSQDAGRREFLLGAEQYLELRGEVVRRKSVLKAWYRRGGVMVSDTATVFSPKGRQRWLAQLPPGSWRSGALGQHSVLDAVEAAWENAWQRLKELGRNFAEVARFTAMPGVGEVSAHLFSALISDPHRFATRQKLWRYCKLGVTDRSSDGKPLGYERLERHGNGPLKGLSYHIWKGAIVARDDNEVKRFYAQSLDRTGDKRHARLNTQRKILDTLWTLWLRGTPYDPERFLAVPAPSRANPTPANTNPMS